MGNIETEKVLNFFNLSAEKIDRSCLSDLRVSAGEYDQQALSALIETGLVEYDTRTGIAFQQPDEWDVMLSPKAINLLTNSLY